MVGMCDGEDEEEKEERRMCGKQMRREGSEAEECSCLLIPSLCLPPGSFVLV